MNNSNNSRKINVSIYGGKGLFGGKEKPYRAEIIYCDNCDNCTFYQQGKCLNMARKSMNSFGCPVGRVEHADGYTSRAKKFDNWYSKYKNDECYAKLSMPTNADFGVLGDGTLFFNLGYAKLIKTTPDKENYRHRVLSNGYAIEENYSFSCIGAFLKREEVDADFLYKIFTFCPRNIFGESYVKYGTVVVPNILARMKILVPDLYEELVAKYPEMKDKLPDYRGRYAYIKSLRQGLEIRTDDFAKGIIQGNKIIIENYRSSLLPFNCKVATRMELEFDDTTVIKILDNNWCDENTLFR